MMRRALALGRWFLAPPDGWKYDSLDAATARSSAMTSRDELFEKLAAIEHERWSDWQRWLHYGAGTFRNPAGTITLGKADVDRWERQMNTPYEELSEREKESDREQVRRYWSLLQEFLVMDEVET